VNTKRNKILLTLGAAAVVATIGASAVSLALFTSTAVVPGNTFSTGTVQIGTSPTSALVTYSNMAPGDQVTAPITVSNTGSLDLRYAITSVATNVDSKGLKDQLVLTIKSGVTTCDNGNWAADGTTVYTGDLDSSTGALVGDVTPGSQGGDRTVAAGGNEVLCFNVGLPISTGNAFQGATTTATFTFSAEQTKNNP
jgi:predicted ribosomally synthesized peptide with SipW-like signal peptide